MNEYRPVLETGMTEDADKTLNQFLEALDEAGMEKIIEENRRQLGVWLKEQEKE